ncbi:MAG: PLDc N-terminal domain-containing protein, partial [Proteobacteria bacterium]|nr:PLDc N-terminal domain-containing protein [Pseudomonadota bacterium]
MESLFHPSWGYAATVVLTMGGYLLALVLIPRILLDRRDPEATMAWILAIIFLPYLGAAAFYLLGRTRVRRRTRKKLLARFRVQRSLNTLPETSPAVDIPPAGAGREVAKLVRYVTENPLVPGNRVRIFTGGEAAYDQMEAAIESAREHIHLMSYIFHKDEIGHRFLDLLTQQAERGVEVRLLVDAFGASDLPGSFVKPLIEAGGRFSRFGPMLGAKRRWRPNLRNHRKILVVDGRIGFTGGLNIGDEYRGRKEKWRPWRDTHLGLDGPAVRYLQAVFVEDWMFSQGEDLAESRYFPEIPEQGRELVQVVDSGPDHDHETIHTVFFTAINEASDRIWITTPYFVPTPAMLLALKSAAWRGLDIRILLPGR